MPLPLPSDVESMDVALDGSSAVYMATKPSVKTETLDYFSDAQPFMTVPNYIYQSVDIEETIRSTDSSTFFLSATISELVPRYDDYTTNFVESLELGRLTDTVDPIREVNYEELGITLDSVSPTLIVEVEDEELVVSTDDVSTGLVTIVDYVGLGISISEYVQDYETLPISVGDYHEDEQSLDISVASYDLAPVTAVASAFNPFLPTVAINGNVIVANAETNPGSTVLANTNIYIHWLSSGIDGNKWTDLSNFNFELDYFGGHFSISSRNPLNTLNPLEPTISFDTNYYSQPLQGAYKQITALDQLTKSNLGKNITIFGLSAGITDFGASISDSNTSWQTQGIFGSLLLPRNMSYLAYGGASYMNTILTNERFEQLITTTPTCKGLARALARIVGVDVNWYCQDLAVENTFRYDGLSVLEVLGTLAAQVGGSLRWNGDNSYVVAYPDQAIGVWEVIDPKLLTTNGLSYMQHLDLTTGVGNTGLIIIPKTNTNKNSKSIPADAASNQQNTPALQQIGAKIRTKLTNEDPAIIYDLPYNYDVVYIQILVPEGSATGGSNLISLHNFITKDPTQWFVFDSALLSGQIGANTEYIFTTYIGDTYIPQIKMDYKVFTVDGANDAIDNNHFVLSLACSLKSIKAIYDEGKQQIEDRIRNNLAASFEQFRFIRTYTGTFACQFFGSLPMPGMWGRATIPGGATIYTVDPETGDPQTSRIPLDGDFIVEGVIEHVQFSYPGTVIVQVAQYARMDYSKGNYAGVSVFNAGIAVDV